MGKLSYSNPEPLRQEAVLSALAFIEEKSQVPVHP